MARHLTLTVPLSAQVYKWVPANLMLGVTLQWSGIMIILPKCRWYFPFQVKVALLLTLALGFLRDVEGSCARNVKSLLDNASGPPNGQCVKNTVAIRICNKFYTAVTCRNDNGCRGRPAIMIRAQCCDGTSVTLPTDCYWEERRRNWTFSYWYIFINTFTQILEP